MYSILIIHMYFGTLPKMFLHFLKSCEDNADVDFLIISDQPISTNASNVYLYNCKLSDIKKRADLLMGFDTSLETPRKLCDYKAVYGLLLPEYVNRYDFWGYCDSDLLFGKIRNFITDDILQQYDYILGMGHFHLQRTKDPKFDSVWKSARGVGDNAFYEPNFDQSRFLELNNGPMWETVFRSPYNHIFDEFPYGVSAQYFYLYPDKIWTGYSKIGRCFDDIDPAPLYFRDIFNSYPAYLSSHYAKLSLVFPFFQRKKIEAQEFEPIIYRKHEGRLFRIGICPSFSQPVIQETLYVHFLHRKIAVKTKDFSRYVVYPNKIVDDEAIDYDKIIKYSRRKSLKISRNLQRIAFQISRLAKLRKIIKQFYVNIRHSSCL